MGCLHLQRSVAHPNQVAIDLHQRSYTRVKVLECCTHTLCSWYDTAPAYDNGQLCVLHLRNDEHDVDAHPLCPACP